MNSSKSKDTFLYIYSKYSKDCNTLLPIIHQIAPSTELIAIDADKPKIRNYLLSLNIFKKVPCIILSYPSENRLEIIEGYDVIELINKILKMLGKPSVEEQLSFKNKPSTIEVPSMRKTTHLPSVIENKKTQKSTTGKTMLDFSSLEDEVPQKLNKSSSAPKAVRIDDPFEHEKELQQLANMDPNENHKNSYIDRVTNPNMNIKKGEGHEGMKSSLNSNTEVSSPEENQISTNITSLDDDYSFGESDNFNDNDNSLLMSKTKVNMSDLLGTNGPPPNKELEAKQDRIKNAAAAMMSEREALDSQFNKHKGGSG